LIGRGPFRGKKIDMNSRFVIGPVSVVRVVWVVALVWAVVAGGLWGSALRAQEAAVSSGAYTADQAKRGEAVYTMSCANCHLEDLSGGTSPPLQGTDFLNNWKGKTLGALFEQTRMTMPFDNPGGLTAAQYADVLAYVLSKNMFKAADKELPSDATALQQITLDEPK
jgi:mono/diheme cytochrome c family protein